MNTVSERAAAGMGLDPVLTKVTRNSGPRELVRNDGVTDEIASGNVSSSAAPVGVTIAPMKAMLIDAARAKAPGFMRPPDSFRNDVFALVDDERIHRGHEFNVAVGFAAAGRQEIEITVQSSDEAVDARANEDGCFHRTLIPPCCSPGLSPGEADGHRKPEVRRGWWGEGVSLDE